MTRIPVLLAGLAGLAIGFLVAGNSATRPSDPVFGAPITLEDRELPFSEAVRVGSVLYLSGQIGIPPGGTALVEGGIGPETRQVMDNIRRIVEDHGSSMGRVVKCTVFLADMAEWAEMNSVYVTYFPENRPARSALAVDGLALGARTEIECIAITDD